MVKVKMFFKRIMPPFLLNLSRTCFRLIVGDQKGKEEIGEKPKEWYDGEYKKQAAYHQHYTDSSYYFIWTVIADRLVHSRVKNVIDIGCGSGQFAALLFDKKISNYIGVDLSDEAIRLARENCLGYRFISENVFESNLLKQQEYDCFVTLECLEHLEQDIELLEMVEPGTLCFFTVPNFPYISHVRFFDDEESVAVRYREFFQDFSVDTFWENSSGKKFFLVEGIKNK